MIQTTLNWHLCEKEQPTKDGDYFIAYKSDLFDGISHIGTLQYATGEDGGWNCYRHFDGEVMNAHRIDDVFAWADIKDVKKSLEDQIYDKFNRCN